MKKFILSILSIIALGFTMEVWSENTQKYIDSLKTLLKTQPNDTNRVICLNELSAYLGDFDKYEEAYQYARQAQVLAEKLHYRSGVASSLRKFGVTLIQEGQFAKALEFLFKSLKINDSLKNNRELFMLHNNIGTVYCLKGDYSNALNYFFKARQYKNAFITTGNMAWATANIGWTFLEQGKYRSAIEYYQKSLELYTEAGDKNGMGSMTNSIGTALEYLGDNKKALKYYLKSLKIKEEIEDKPGIVDALAGIGDIYAKEGLYNLALKYELKSLWLAKEIRYAISAQQTYQKLSEIYDQLKNKDMAYYNYRQYVGVKDSLYNEEQTKKSVRAEMNFSFEKQQDLEKFAQDKKDEITIQEKKRQKIVIYSVSICLFLVLLLAIFIFRGYRQKRKDNLIISEQKRIVDDQNHDITSSIVYAKRIQDAILPPDDLMKQLLPNHFLFFNPKSIVSGDFYFLAEKNGKILWATCDATGHGPSASLLSMLGVNILSGIVKDGEIIPSRILDKLNKSINESLHKTSDDSIRDGMDVTFCSLDKDSMMLNYSGANNGLWLIRNGQIIEYKPDKMPIGQMYKESSYTNNEIQLQTNDCIYSFSDGICDLHSEDNKKFMKKRLRELLLSIQDKSMPEQKIVISETLNLWKGKCDQVDDMLLLGIRI